MDNVLIATVSHRFLIVARCWGVHWREVLFARWVVWTVSVSFLLAADKCSICNEFVLCTDTVLWLQSVFELAWRIALAHEGILGCQVSTLTWSISDNVLSVRGYFKTICCEGALTLLPIQFVIIRELACAVSSQLWSRHDCLWTLSSLITQNVVALVSQLKGAVIVQSIVLRYSPLSE